MPRSREAGGSIQARWLCCSLLRVSSNVIWGEPQSPFREWIAPGSFARSIERDEIGFFRTHDEPWASTSDRALKLVDDAKSGLRFELTPPSGMVGDALLDWVRMGSFSGMSIRFRIDECEWRHQGTERIRIIRQATLRHIAAIPKPGRPAYPQTSIRIECADWQAEAENRRLQLELRRARRPMKFQSHNLTEVSEKQMDHFLDEIAARVLTVTPTRAGTAPPPSRIFASVRNQIRRPLAIVRLRRTITVGKGHEKVTTYGAGWLVVIGWKRLAVRSGPPMEAKRMPPNCPICDRPIDPERDVLYGRRYHSRCIPSCAKCGKPVNAGHCRPALAQCDRG